ncbi:putative glycoside hydrolase [Thermobacillus sp. ZCTH02-B1]|uniref:putative glycoside hydrolase n=1 Tax=Thermobacillus sp. ZCTH02-B1 TaxID=1858795 RepID=UPI0025E812E6|nr:putative glycoside hydrolase [Thermobacillus sp. ZCTH02-B1]
MTVRALAVTGMVLALAAIAAGGCAAADPDGGRTAWKERPDAPKPADIREVPDSAGSAAQSDEPSGPIGAGKRPADGRNAARSGDDADTERSKFGGGTRSDGPAGTGARPGSGPGTGADRGVSARARAGFPGVPAGVRGIYVSGWIAGSGEPMERLIRLVEETDLNAMVIDVKNDHGRLTYRSSLPLVKAVGADRDPPVRDMAGLIRRLKAKRIYTIGRVVVFKDPLLAQAKPEWAFRRKDGGLWRDRKGVPWVEPYLPEVREYNIAIAKEAASLGFDEIQFDYVRFPDNGEAMDRAVRYRNPEGWTKREAIGRFLREARDQLHTSGAAVSADVFGLVTTARDDMGIGQTWREIAPAVDAISPMIYPSHYAAGSYGIRHPDLEPAAVVRRALEDAGRRNRILAAEGKRPARIRPWLQAFTATWLSPHRTYRAAEIRAQIRAAEAAGVTDFLLWDPACTYEYPTSFTRQVVLDRPKNALIR